MDRDRVRRMVVACGTAAAAVAAVAGIADGASWSTTDRVAPVAVAAADTGPGDSAQWDRWLW